MFGFVKSEKEVRELGGEVIRMKKRRMKFLLIFFMITGFILVNFVLYYLTDL
jgi:predicted nucleic acid-binding Zn ribbon protein